MRIWVDPSKFNNYGLTTSDVVNGHPRAERAGIRGFHRRLAGPPGTAINFSIIGLTRLSTPGQFRSILLRVNTDGSQVRIGDVARVR